MSAPASGEPGATGDPRVFLAIERTYLAWTRTALALMGFGFVVARLGLYLRDVGLYVTEGGKPLPNAPPLSLWWGTALVVLGVVVQGMAIAERREYLRRFNAGEAIAPAGWSLARLVGLVLIAIGIAMAVQLVLLY